MAVCTRQQAREHCNNDAYRSEGPADDAVVGCPGCSPVPGAPGDGGIAGVGNGHGVWHVEGASASVCQGLQVAVASDEEMNPQQSWQSLLGLWGKLTAAACGGCKQMCLCEHGAQRCGHRVSQGEAAWGQGMRTRLTVLP